jgi:hypothetical protein
MKFPFSTAVVGTSFRPEVAASARPGLSVVIRPEPDNPVDPHAVAVDLGGNQLGYLPRALAARLAGGPWTGEIVEVFGNDRLGIRIRILGPVSATGTATATGNRYTIDTTRRGGTSVLTSTERHHIPAVPVTTAAANDLSSTATTTPVADEIVKARSGRVLGSYVRTEADRVFVRTDNGNEVAYPAALVTRERRTS